MNLVIVNNGDKRASYAVAISGHLLPDGAIPFITKRSIDTLKQTVDIGAQWGVTDKLESSICERLRSFPHGEDVFTWLENNGVSVITYVSDAHTILQTVSKAEGGTGERAKRGQGHVTKANKFLGNVAAKLVCRYAPASDKIDDKMLLEGFELALEAFQNLDKADVIAAAKKLAEKTGVDPDGRIRLRSESSTGDEDGE